MWRHADIRNLAEIPSIHAQERPQHIALVDPAGQLSFAELEKNTARFAGVLNAAGVAEAAHVGFIGKNSALYFQVLFGAMRAGCALLPLNWRLAVPELASVMADAQLSLVVADREFLAMAQAAKELAGLTFTLIEADSARSGDSELDARLAAAASQPAVSAAIDPRQTALLIYTSGTTGKPKGVCISHQALNYMRLCEHLEPALSWQQDDVMLMVMPNFHLVGTALALQSLYNGSTVSILAALDPGKLIDLIERDRPTICALVPTAIQMMLDHPRAATADLSSLRLVMYAGSSISSTLLKRALKQLKCRFMQFYGGTELSGQVTLLRPEQHRLDDEQKLKSCGTPMPLMELRVVDPAGNDLPHGEIGELWVRTPTIFSHYWNQPEATAASFSGSWYRTGDAAKRDEEGFFYIVDRIKDMIVSGGENVYSTEVEQALQRHPAVNMSAVIGVADDKWGERVVAAVVLLPDQQLSAADLIEHCRQHIAGYKVPKQIHFVSSLPVTPSGKVAKRVLRDDIAARA
ncbi:long-chain-fatty-acid--CoA ligase [Hydrocarboniphaga sp.]|uniref:long-chain-fatty-acid--CoA ligase n=1 Tax=Hydrocarboniphaga sp. TaxID=2033016 RepID=UPI003D0E607C